MGDPVEILDKGVEARIAKKNKNKEVKKRKEKKWKTNGGKKVSSSENG